MEIRKLDRKTDEDRFFELTGRLFPIDVEKKKGFFGNALLWDYIYGIFDGERLVSQYVSTDTKVRIRDRTFNGHYLDIVGTLPTYRNRGFMRSFMAMDFERSRDLGVPLIFLDPFKASYYRKFGFETAMENYSVKIGFDLLSETVDCEGYSVDMDSLRNMKEPYEKASGWLFENSPYNGFGMIPPYMDEIYGSSVLCAVAYDGDKKPRGYMIYMQTGRNMIVNTFRYATLKAFYALKKHILSYADQVHEVDFPRTPGDFPLDLLAEDRWSNGRSVERKDASTRMMRILDAERFLSEIVGRYAGEIRLGVKDDLLSSNEGTYLIRDGIVKKETGGADLEIGIRDLSPLATGMKSASRLYREGKLSASEDEISVDRIPEKVLLLERILPERITFNAEECFD